MIYKDFSNEIKILLVINEELNYNYAPAAKYLALNEELTKEGFNSTLVGRPSKSESINCKRNITIIKPIIKGVIGKVFVKIQILFGVINLLIKDKEIKKVIIRNNDPELAIFLIPTIKILKRELIYDFSGYLYRERVVEGRILRASLIKPLEILSLIFSDRILILSEGLKGVLPKKLRKRTILLPTGISPFLFVKGDKDKIKKTVKKYGINLNKKIVGFIGNWEKWISIDNIINCANYLKGYLFLIIGEGYKFKVYHKNNIYKKNIIFTGLIPYKEALNLLRIMDTVIVPYKRGPPYSNIKGSFSSSKVKEALAFGKPLIVSDVIGKEDFLKEYENALFYKPNNAKDLAKKIRLLLEDKELYEKISKNNLQLSKKFSWEILLEKSGLLNYLRNG